MPTPLGTFINGLATKAGVKADNQALKDLLSNAELSKINVPDELLTEMESNLHTLDSAKPKLKNILFAEAMNGVDAKLGELMTEFEFDDALKAKILAEKSTPERAALLAKAVKELEGKKAAAKPGDKQEYIEQINALKAEKAKLLTDAKTKEDTLIATHTEQLNDAAIIALLSPYEYALGDIDPQIKSSTALQLLRTQASNDGVKWVRGENGQLKLVTAKDGSEYFDKSNNKQDLKSYMEGAISPILKKSDSSEEEGKTGDKTKIIPGSNGVQGGNFQSVLDQKISEARGVS